MRLVGDEARRCRKNLGSGLLSLFLFLLVSFEENAPLVVSNGMFGQSKRSDRLYLLRLGGTG